MACCRTKDVALEDSPSLNASRAQYESNQRYSNATRPPFVLRGDFIDGQTYWIGELTTQWARNWIDYWTGGRGTFTTTAMEDTGVCRALIKLDAAGSACSIVFCSFYIMLVPAVSDWLCVVRADVANRG